MRCLSVMLNKWKDNAKGLNNFYYVTRIHACMQGSEQPSEKSNTLRALTTGSPYEAKNSFLYNSMTDARKPRCFCSHGNWRNLIQRAFRREELNYVISTNILSKQKYNNVYNYVTQHINTRCNQLYS